MVVQRRDGRHRLRDSGDDDDDDEDKYQTSLIDTRDKIVPKTKFDDHCDKLQW